MSQNYETKHEKKFAELNALANRIICNTPNAEHVLYAVETLSRMYLNELEGNEPLDLADVTTQWESLNEAIDNFELYPDLEPLASADSNADVRREYKPRVKPGEYIAAVVDKYFKTKGKQRNCLVVQQALRNKLLDVCRQYGIRMPKSKITPEAWTKDWNPSTYKFDAKTGKSLVIEGFEHLYKVLSRIIYSSYNLLRMSYSIRLPDDTTTVVIGA